MIPGFAWFKRAMTVAMSCGLLLFGACNKSGGGGVTYANSYAGAFETASSFQFLAQTVNFTINWNESGGTITGVYQDDYFATSGISISGSTSNGAASFVISLPQEMDGVSTLDFVVTNTASGAIASVTGKSSTGATVFADSDIALEKKSTGSTGSGAPTTVDGFFALLAGEYDWVAKNSGGTDDQWNAGETYKVKITADKKITIPSNDGDVEIVFGAEASDKFEAHDHEINIMATRGECEYLLQHDHESNETFLTCAKGKELTSPFWTFKAKTGTSSGALADLEIGGAAGNHAWVVLSATSGHGTPYDYGAEFKFQIDAEANVKSDLGDFTYSEENFHKVPITMNGEVVHHSATWYSPSKTAVPRKEFNVEANADELISVIIKDYREGGTTIMYVIGESLP